MKRFITAGALLAAVALVAWFAWHSGDRTRDAGGNQVQPTTTITLTEARAKQLRTRIDAVGSAEARQSVTLFPASAGEVVAVDFQAGQSVEQGQTLLQLDARDERLALELAEARLADARRTLQRYTSAGEGAAFTQQQLDAARIAAEEARIERDRAAVALDDRSVEAPFDGVVGLTDVDVGDRITTTTAIATLDDRSVLLVRFPVPEAFLGQLEVGDTVDLMPWNSIMPTATATLSDIDSRVDETTRTFTVRARLDNASDRWRPGMGFRVELELIGDEYVQVPELALQWGGSGAYVWTVGADDRAHRTPVTLIQRGDGNVLLDGDIAPGERVVLEGVQNMSEGRAVEVVDPDDLDDDRPVPARMETSA